MAKKIKVSGTTTLTITRNGRDATIYAIRLSAGSVNLSSISADGKTGTPSPASVTVTVTRQTGDEAPVTVTALSPGWQLQFRMVTRAGGDSGWAAVAPGASVPSSTSTACASYQYRLIDDEKNVRAEASCTYVQDGLNGGTNGENAVGAVVTPATAVFVKSSEGQASPVYIDLYDGQTRVPFNGTATAGDGTFGCSVMVGGGVIDTDGLGYSGAKSGDRLAVTFSLAAGRAVSKTVTLNLRYKTATIPVTVGIETVENGADGRDAPQLVISPQAVTFKKSGGGTQTQRVYIDLYDGGERVPYQDKAKGEFLCHALAAVGEDVTDGLGWGYKMDDDGRFYYNLKLRAGKVVCFNVPFTYQYRGVTYSAIIPVNTVTDGIRGGRGPALRLMLWSSCNTGFPFEDGSEGCTYLDCVIYEDAYYLCNTSHAKAADNNPGSDKDTNGNLWKGANKFNIVATKLLLAQYALIDNLGVKYVEVQGDDGEIVMTDSEGNVRFRVKDGQITCSTGTFSDIVVNRGQFNDVDIDGNITAKTIDLKECESVFSGLDARPFEGSFCRNVNGIILPKLEKGSTRLIRVFNPRLADVVTTDGTTANLYLQGEDNTVFVSPSMDEKEATERSMILYHYGMSSGHYLELFGYNATLKSGDSTVWLCSESRNEDLKSVSSGKEI